MVNKGEHELKHRASMGRMGAACIISAGYGMTKGAAATMTVFPIVPDFEKNILIMAAVLAIQWAKLVWQAIG